MPLPRPALALLVLPMGGCSAITDLFGPGVPNPYAGEDTLLLELACDAAGAAAASNLVGERLTRLDLSHSVTADPSGTLTVTTRGASASQLEALAGLLTATPDLGFHATLDDQAPLRPRHAHPEEAVLDAFPATGGRPDMAFDVEAMQAMLAISGGALPPVEGVRIAERFDEREVYAAPPGADWGPWLETLRLPEGTAVVSECWEDYGEDELCSPLLVADPAPVTAANVMSAELMVDPQHGSPYLQLQFDEAGKAAFHTLTEGLVDRYLAIVSEGRVLSRPRVAEPIPGGSAWLTMGSLPQESELAELWRFHALLETGPLPSPCTVQGSEVVR